MKEEEWKHGECFLILFLKLYITNQELDILLFVGGDKPWQRNQDKHNLVQVFNT